MKNVFLGEYIKQRRLDLGLTQEQLCEGICEPMTLSRLENGKQTPSRNRINALLQRLGLPDDRYFALLSKNELEMEALQKEIVACNVTEKVSEGFEKLAQFEKLSDLDDPIAQQFILRSREVLGCLDRRYTPQERIDLLMQAIRLTVPRFELDQIEQFLYSKSRSSTRSVSPIPMTAKMKKRLRFTISCLDIYSSIFKRLLLRSVCFR